MADEKPTQRVELRIPFTTLLKIALAVLLVVSVVKLWPLLILFFIAVLLAVMFEPLVAFLERRTGRRAWGILAVSLILLAALAFVAGVVIPRTTAEVAQLGTHLPQAQAQIARAGAEAHRGWVAVLMQKAIALARGADIGRFLPGALAASRAAAVGIMALVFALVLTVYFLAEGRTMLAWLVSYVPREHRAKVRETLPEFSLVALAYMRGQAITCTICGLWVWLMLTLLHVPAALALASIAFVADLVPVVGTIVMTAPGVMLALTISPLTAALALLGYVAYHLIESYVIIPRVYGKQMRLSTLTVLLAVAVGGALQGVAGAVLVLPIVAAYPVIERVWLRDWVGEQAVRDHAALDASDGDQQDAEADRIIGKLPE